MADLGEFKERSAFDASPYAPPPAVLDDGRVSLTLNRIRKFPKGLSVFYSLVATAISFAGAWTADTFSDGWGGFFLVIGPPYALIAGFVGLCFYVLDRGVDIAGPSTAWKIFIAFAVPPASMLCFVPTCAGTAVAVWPTMGNSLGGLAIAIPVFVAYWVTFSVIAYRIRSRLARRNTASITAPFNALVTASEITGPIDSTPGPTLP